MIVNLYPDPKLVAAAKLDYEMNQRARATIIRDHVIVAWDDLPKDIQDRRLNKARQLLNAAGAVESRRFFVDCDHSCHHYLIPLDKKAEWDAFRKIPENDPSGWDAPDFARRIDSPYSLTFVDVNENRF